MTKAARGEVDKLVQAGHTECDFAILIEQVATVLLARFVEVADRLR